MSPKMGAHIFLGVCMPLPIIFGLVAVASALGIGCGGGTAIIAYVGTDKLNRDVLGHKLGEGALTPRAVPGGILVDVDSKDELGAFLGSLVPELYPDMAPYPGKRFMLTESEGEMLTAMVQPYKAMDRQVVSVMSQIVDVRKMVAEIAALQAAGVQVYEPGVVIAYNTLLDEQTKLANEQKSCVRVISMFLGEHKKRML